MTIGFEPTDEERASIAKINERARVEYRWEDAMTTPTGATDTGNLTSRKLIGAIAAQMSAVGLIIGVSVAEPSLFTDAPEIIFTALTGIFALGGWQVYQQASVDRNGK